MRRNNQLYLTTLILDNLIIYFPTEQLIRIYIMTCAYVSGFIGKPVLE